MSKPEVPPIPGAGVMSGTLDFIKHLWGAMNVPGLVAPTLSVDELDKRIADLKAVEAWITMNAAMLRGTIHTLEVQRATVATLRSMGASLAEAMPQAQAAAPAGTEAHPGLAESAAAWWNMLQHQFGHAMAGAMTAAAGTPESEPAAAQATTKTMPKAARKPAAAKKPAAGRPRAKKPARDAGN